MATQSLWGDWYGPFSSISHKVPSEVQYIHNEDSCHSLKYFRRTFLSSLRSIPFLICQACLAHIGSTFSRRKRIWDYPNLHNIDYIRSGIYGASGRESYGRMGICQLWVSSRMTHEPVSEFLIQQHRTLFFSTGLVGKRAALGVVALIYWALHVLFLLFSNVCVAINLWRSQILHCRGRG